MKIKYMAYSESIKKVEIKRETETSIWDERDRRHSKMSSYECYFDTFQEAKNYLLKNKLQRIENYECNIINLRKDVDKINSIQDIT